MGEQSLSELREVTKQKLATAEKEMAEVNKRIAEATAQDGMMKGQ